MKRSIDGGCVLLERWRGNGGFSGSSLNSWSAASRQWHQHWVDNQGGLPHPLTLDPAVPGTGEWINTSIYVFRPDQPLAGDHGGPRRAKAVERGGGVEQLLRTVDGGAGRLQVGHGGTTSRRTSSDGRRR